MSFDMNRIAILNIDGVDYCFIIVAVSKIEAINLFKNADYSESSRNIKNYENIKKSSCIVWKMDKEIITFSNIEIGNVNYTIENTLST